MITFVKEKLPEKNYGRKTLGPGQLGLKTIFFATNILVGNFCANKIGQKTPKKLPKLPKKGKMVINCAFLHLKTQILHSL